MLITQTKKTIVKANQKAIMKMTIAKKRMTRTAKKRMRIVKKMKKKMKVRKATNNYLIYIFYNFINLH